jgi:hypothetical protein
MDRYILFPVGTIIDYTYIACVFSLEIFSGRAFQMQ